MLDLVPSARVGHIGIYREPETLSAVEYYYKVPEDLQERRVIVVDPMLATGNSASPRSAGSRRTARSRIKFVCLLAAPEGIRHVPRRASRRAGVHRGDRPAPQRHGYIVPGLGDAGDRLYGTK